MNKKFFTLIASVLMLVGFVGSGYAQTPPLANGTVPATLKKDGGKYQIAVTTKFGLNTVLSGGSLVSTGATDYATWTSSSWSSATPAADAAGDAQKILDKLSGDVTTLTGTPPWTGTSWDNASLLWYAWMDKDGFLKGEPRNFFTGKYYETIFCVNYSRESSQGQPTTLSILNWANKLKVAIDYVNAVNAAATTYPKLNAKDGLYGDWNYALSYNKTLQHWRPLHLYKEGDRDSVYIFVADPQSALTLPTATAPSYNLIKLVKIGANDLYNNKLPDEALLFEFVEPAPVILSAEDYNTMLGSVKPTAQKLTFTGDTKTKTFVPNNGYGPWRDVALTAYDVTPISLGLFPLPGGSQSYGGTFPGAATDKWLYFQASAGDHKGNFLRVDTGYYGDINNTLKYNWGDTLSAYTRRTFFTEITASYGYTTAAGRVGEVDTTGLWNLTHTKASDFINQYRFQATYFWTNDSLAIDVAEANFRYYDDPKKFYEVKPLYWTPPYYELASRPH